jgi:hypothetical protein
MAARSEASTAMSKRSRAALGVLALSASLALSACSPSSPPTDQGPSATASPSASASAVDLPPGDLLDQAIINTRDAPSKRVSGDASVPFLASAQFDIIFVGEDAKGTQIQSAPGISTTTEFVQVGDSLYILADEHYWQSYVNLEFLSQVSNKWVRVPADHPNHSALLVIEDGAMQGVGAVVEAGTDTIDGVPVIVLEDADENAFSVATEGEPYLLRFAGSKTQEGITVRLVVNFSEFGTITESITVPPGEIINLT